MYTIAIDAMGGDYGPKVVVPAVARALKQHPDLKVILVGKSELLNRYVKRLKIPLDRLEVVHASQTVEMDESPAVALRTKKDSAMRVAVDLVKEGRAHGCVSAGNTGALMATARFVLKTIPGISRPAIVVDMPTLQPDKFVRLLDLGANVDCTPEQMLQFAIMGSALVSAADGIESPKVALLNIGTEDMKGNELVQQTAELLANQDSVNYVGFAEGGDIFKGAVDVIVCDGFVGNVLLKTSEGVVKFMTSLIKRAAKKTFLHKLALLPAALALRSTMSTVDPRNHNGTIFIGLNGIVVKSHGNAKVPAFANAIEVALSEVSANIPDVISKQVAREVKES
jgi:phosphate acyltransferase